MTFFTFNMETQELGSLSKTEFLSKFQPSSDRCVAAFLLGYQDVFIHADICYTQSLKLAQALHTQKFEARLGSCTFGKIHIFNTQLPSLSIHDFLRAYLMPSEFTDLRNNSTSNTLQNTTYYQSAQITSFEEYDASDINILSVCEALFDTNAPHGFTRFDLVRTLHEIKSADAEHLLQLKIPIHTSHVVSENGMYLQILNHVGIAPSKKVTYEPSNLKMNEVFTDHSVFLVGDGPHFERSLTKDVISFSDCQYTQTAIHTAEGHILQVFTYVMPFVYDAAKHTIEVLLWSHKFFLIDHLLRFLTSGLDMSEFAKRFAGGISAIQKTDVIVHPQYQTTAYIDPELLEKLIDLQSHSAFEPRTELLDILKLYTNQQAVKNDILSFVSVSKRLHFKKSEDVALVENVSQIKFDIL